MTAELTRLDPNAPEEWVIVVDSMSHNQAMELGKAMGKMGLTGQFLSGSLARNLQRFSKWLREQNRKGGEG